MYLIFSMFVADGFICFIVFQLKMDDGNIFSDKMSPPQNVLIIHLLVDSVFQCPYANCIYSCLHLQFPYFYSVEHSLYTCHIFVCTLFGLFLGKEKDKHGWNWYITPLPLTQRQQVPLTHWNLSTKLHNSENHKLNAHYHENFKSHTRKNAQLLHWPTWRKSQDKPTKLSSQNLPAEPWGTLFFKPTR